MTRKDGRAPDELREIKITRGFIESAEGSALIEFGRTRSVAAAGRREQEDQRGGQEGSTEQHCGSAYPRSGRMTAQGWEQRGHRWRHSSAITRARRSGTPPPHPRS